MVSTRALFATSLIALTTIAPIKSHGFGADTLIWASGDWKTIQTVCEEIVHESISHQTPSRRFFFEVLQKM